MTSKIISEMFCPYFTRNKSTGKEFQIFLQFSHSISSKTEGLWSNIMFISYFVKFSFLFSSLMCYLFNGIRFKHIKQSSFCLVLDFLITSTSASLTTQKPLTVWIITNCGKFLRDGKTRSPFLPPEKPVCRSRSNS